MHHGLMYGYHHLSNDMHITVQQTARKWGQVSYQIQWINCSGQTARSLTDRVGSDVFLDNASPSVQQTTVVPGRVKPCQFSELLCENTEECKVWVCYLYLLLRLADNYKCHPIYCNPSIIVFSVNIWEIWTNDSSHQVGQSLDLIPLFSQPSLPTREPREKPSYVPLYWLVHRE